MSVEVKKREGNSLQIQQRKTSLFCIYRYFDNHEGVTASDLKRDLKMSPNGIQRDLNRLKNAGLLYVATSQGNERKRGKRILYYSFKNLKITQYLIDAHRLYEERKKRKTKFDVALLQDMIVWSETDMTKNQVAKMFGLKSAKSFERLIKSHPSLVNFRDEFRANKGNKSWNYFGYNIDLKNAAIPS